MRSRVSVETVCWGRDFQVVAWAVADMALLGFPGRAPPTGDGVLVILTLPRFARVGLPTDDADHTRACHCGAPLARHGCAAARAQDAGGLGVPHCPPAGC